MPFSFYSSIGTSPIEKAKLNSPATKSPQPPSGPYYNDRNHNFRINTPPDWPHPSASVSENTGRLRTDGQKVEAYRVSLYPQESGGQFWINILVSKECLAAENTDGSSQEWDYSGDVDIGGIRASKKSGSHLVVENLPGLEGFVRIIFVSFKQGDSWYHIECQYMTSSRLGDPSLENDCDFAIRSFRFLD